MKRTCKCAPIHGHKDTSDDVDDVASRRPRRLVCTMSGDENQLMGLKNGFKNASTSNFQFGNITPMVDVGPSCDGWDELEW